MPNLLMGIRNLMSDTKKKLEEAKQSALPTTDMGLSKGMPDWMKPQFRINSLDRQNNDPLRTGSIDSFRGNTDIKPLPSATFSGSVSKIPNLTLQ